MFNKLKKLITKLKCKYFGCDYENTGHNAFYKVLEKMCKRCGKYIQAEMYPTYINGYMNHTFIKGEYDVKRVKRMGELPYKEQLAVHYRNKLKGEIVE